jgi:hypothetical protein
MELEKQKLILSTGKTAWFEYERNNDLTTCGVLLSHV